MAHTISRERFKAFILRRKLNAFGLLVITLLSLITTIICALVGFKRTDVLVIVTILLIARCFVQRYKMRSSFRTIKSTKGFRRKKKRN